MAAANFAQNHFRWYADDQEIGTDQNPLAAEDANPSRLVTGTNYRIRFEVACTFGSDYLLPRIEVKEDGGTWTALGASGNVFYNDSPYFADDSVIANSLLTSSGTYRAGVAKDAGATVSVMLSITMSGGDYTEYEWCIRFGIGAVGHSYQFRLIRTNGMLLNSYTAIPQASPCASASIGAYHRALASAYGVNQ